ncbi:NACHT domain-containing protein [Qipengyuania sp. DSG2-2]|uniref:NACHT domain-containing protein n=1 Tax=Qipengyuania sp. DGS2-2 TaxID=3349631 RepID=UPI0036D3ED24
MHTEDSIQSLSDDLAPFADIGTGPPQIVEFECGKAIRLVRNGIARIISLNSNTIDEDCEGSIRKFSNVRSLLASEEYANLKKWALNQQTVLANELPKDPIIINAALDASTPAASIEIVEGFFSDNTNPLSLALLDGPAGIGKTVVIKSFAQKRAREFTKSQKRLVLHLESRGKILQNIDDLIAINLQSLRTDVTFDQIPALIKHGLILLAVDGFDELGDPNGYELAWAQINELISRIKGSAHVLLAGRETFVSKETILRALPSVSPDDVVGSIEVQPVQSTAARQWLKSRSWTDETLGRDEVKTLLSPASYALRPFFLVQLGQPEIPSSLEKGELDDLLTFIMRSLLDRELEKFGDNVDRVVPTTQRKSFIETLMVEVAREMAENQTDSIASSNLAWLSDVASEGFPEEVRGILRNRASVIAFLTQDKQNGRLRFIHENTFNYWLSHATIISLGARELPKFVRRNILNIDFLETLGTQFSYLDQEYTESVIIFCEASSNSFSDNDRTRRNLLAISMTILSNSETGREPQYSNIFLEEAFISETIDSLYLSAVIFSQLSAKGCDFRAISFDNTCQIFTLIADNGTLPPRSMPRPTLLVLNGVEISNPDEIDAWYLERSMDEVEHRESIEKMGEAISNLPHFKLLQRIVRFRRYWLKDDENDPLAQRILHDSSWPELRKTLEKHELLVSTTNAGTSGRPSDFYHIRNRDAFLDLKHPPEEVHSFLSDLLQISIAEYVDKQSK